MVGSVEVIMVIGVVRVVSLDDVYSKNMDYQHLVDVAPGNLLRKEVPNCHLFLQK